MIALLALLVLATSETPEIPHEHQMQEMPRQLAPIDRRVRCLTPEICAVDILKGEMAPFGGVLLSPKLNATIAEKAKNCSKRIDIHATSSATVAEIRIAAEKEKCEIRMDGANDKIKIRDDIIDQLNWEIFKRDIIIGVGIVAVLVASGVVAGVAIDNASTLRF